MPWQPKYKRHSEECNVLATEFEECINERGIAKFFGKCTGLQRAMGKCFDKERIQKRLDSHEKGQKRREKIYEREKRSTNASNKNGRNKDRNKQNLMDHQLHLTSEIYLEERKLLIFSFQSL